MKTRAAAAFWAALMLALVVFTGAASAGGHGHGGGNGQGDHATAQQSNSDQHQTSSSDQSSSGDNSEGVKPSNSTQHDTHAKASSDKTKKYGNGQTAGQIATKSGYGDADLHGPGNSQPHKVNCGGHEVDVHALKHKSCGVKGAGHEEQKPAPKPEEQKPAPKPEEHKVTICHATGSATNPYVEITVDEHALKHGHTAAKGDIIPAPASGCPTAALRPANVSVTFCDMESPTTGKLETKDASEVLKHEFNGTPEEARDIVPPFSYNGQSYSQIWTDANQAIFKNGCNAPAQVLGTSTEKTQACTTTKTESEQVVVGVKHFIGPKGSGRFVIIHPSPNSSHYRDKHPDELIYQTVTKTVTVPTDCPSQSTAATGTKTETTTTTQQTTTTAAAAETTAATTTTQAAAPVVASAPPAAGSVLGATAPLNAAAKPKARGGVLGTIAPLRHSVGAATLPFTGLPLWIFALVAAGLIAVGLLARRAGAER